MPRINFSVASIFLLLAACAPAPAPTKTMTVTPAATLTASVTPTPYPTSTETPVPGLSETVITQAEEFFGGSFGVDNDGSLVKEDGTKVEGIKIVAGENGDWAWVKAGETPEQDVTGTPEELAKTKYIVDGHETGDWDGPGWRLERDGTLVDTETFITTDGQEVTVPKFEGETAEQDALQYVSVHANWPVGDLFTTDWFTFNNPKAVKIGKIEKSLPGFQPIGGPFTEYVDPNTYKSSPHIMIVCNHLGNGTIVTFQGKNEDILLVYVAGINAVDLYNRLQDHQLTIPIPTVLPTSTAQP